jgi:hypothetical protein
MTAPLRHFHEFAASFSGCSFQPEDRLIFAEYFLSPDIFQRLSCRRQPSLFYAIDATPCRHYAFYAIIADYRHAAEFSNTLTPRRH